MGEERTQARVLAAASRPEARRDLARLLTPQLAVVECRFEELAEPASHLDAAALVMLLEAGDGPETLATARAARELPAATSLVLLLGPGAAGLAGPALEALQPAQALGYPISQELLRFAVRRAFAAHPGEGARSQQRRAPVLLGVSGAIRQILAQVRQVAPSQIPVLILGETGTGKELVARALHAQSPRAERPFVPLNCGALPDPLLESELFGHRKGAFTGASQDKRGLFEAADGGTLFLDEIGEMSPALQVKLLRVLESHELRPLGETTARRVDVRLVSATNRDLEAAVEEGSFRQDLFYRINTFAIQVPPLRRRRVDIPFLAQHFAEEFGAAHARRITLDEDFIETLTRFEFPGNVRELRNAVERAIALAEPDQPLRAHHLVSATGTALQRPAPDGSLRERVEHLEREVIRETLDRCQGSRSQAAERLGLSRQGLRYKMRRLGLAS